VENHTETNLGHQIGAIRHPQVGQNIDSEPRDVPHFGHDCTYGQQSCGRRHGKAWRAASSQDTQIRHVKGVAVTLQCSKGGFDRA